MNTQLFQTTLQALIHLIISLKITKVANKVDTLRNLLQDWTAEGIIQNQKHLHKIFSKFAEKKTSQVLGLSSKTIHSLRLTFKTYNSYNYQLISSENWHFQIDQTTKQFGIIFLESHLKNYLLLIVSTLEQLAAKRQISCLKGQKSVFTDYQIQYNCQRIQQEVFYNKIKLQLGVNNHIIQTTVTYNFDLDYNKQFNNYGRKLSSQTNCTQGSKITPRLSRKMSVFSFYDQKNDVTIITNDNTDFSYDFQQQSIIINDSEEQQCQLLETEEDKNLRQFKQSLKQFQYLQTFQLF